ncbi:hypothetical protein [Gimesia sp.]
MQSKASVFRQESDSRLAGSGMPKRFKSPGLCNNYKSGDVDLFF